jgi:hypothetical protein
MPGGTPSTTQPIAGPWLSPQVVYWKLWPKALPGIFQSLVIKSGRVAGRRLRIAA